MWMIDSLQLQPSKILVKKDSFLKAWKAILKSLKRAITKNMITYIDSELYKLRELLIKNQNLLEKNYYESLKRKITDEYEFNWETAIF